jgi:uncharacterized membrane protein YcaP (DUF421 family)
VPLTSGSALIDIALRTGIVYLALLLGLRLTGKRQVGQMTPFDFLLLLLLANAVQNAMTGPDTSLTGGLVAAGTLFAVNMVVAWAVRRNARLEKVIEGSPTILIRHGQILTQNLAREGITQDDLLRALREHGVDTVEEVRSAILEVDGSVSVLKEDEAPTIQRSHHRIRGIPRRTA